MNKPFDPTKPVQQRCGRAARIICTDAKRRESIIALVLQEDGKEVLCSYDKNGNFYSTTESNFDLINIPETKKLKFWVNVYEDGSLGEPRESKQVADFNASNERFACIEIEREVKEGEGL